MFIHLQHLVDRWFSPFPLRGLKDMEQESSSMEKRFSFKFLKRMLSYIDSAQEFIAHLGECGTSILNSGPVH